MLFCPGHLCNRLVYRAAAAGCEWSVFFTASWEKTVYCWNLNLGWETNKWILKGFWGAGLYRIVTELMDVVSFAVCFTFFGCCDSHILFSKVVAIQSVCQNRAYNYDAVLHCFIILYFSGCSLLLLYEFSYSLLLACEDKYMQRQEPTTATVLL